MEHACRTVAQHLLKDLTAFAIHRVMGDENRVVMMEVTIADAGTRHMGRGIIAGELDHAFVAGQRAVHGNGEALEQRLAAETGEDMCCGPALMIAALCPDMVEARVVGHFNLHHGIEARSGGAVLQKRHFGVFFELHDVVQHRIRSL